ncbi:MAG: DUF1559 domain-containing protein [Pirellulaceae bacterium]|nr:DUF1559 domain-containing protein [Pirellulaceae bacterium]
MPLRAGRRGFTLTEMLVVIAIIGVLMALLLPAVQYAREVSRKTACANNLRQIGAAFHQHNSAMQAFPNAGRHWTAGRALATSGVPQRSVRQTWGWGYQALPYLEYKTVYDITDNNAATITDDLEVAAAVIKPYFCPTRRKPVALDGTQSGLPTGPRGQIDYAGNGGSGPYVFADPRTYNDPGQNGAVIPLIDKDRVGLGSIKDGAASTLLVGERNFDRRRAGDTLGQADENNGYIDGWDWDVIRWGYDPPQSDAKNDDRRFGSSHAGGANFVFCDGGVRMIYYTIDPAVFESLAARNDGVSPNPNGL